MQNLFRHAILAVCAKVNSNLHEAKARYKLKYDNRAREMLKKILHSYGFIDNVLECANKRKAEFVPRWAYNKVRWRATGPFKVLQVHDYMTRR